jgi:hypothetical protein
MTQRLASTSMTRLGLAGLTLLAALLLWLAPNEKTLGAGIKPVYLHVALTWTGLVGLAAAALAGLVVLLTARAVLERWAHLAGGVGFAFFAAGFGLSMLASQVNWGGIAWTEPRNAAALNTLAAALIAQVVGGWPVPLRVCAALRLLPVVVYGLSVTSAALILHPRNPITTSSALGIQFAFFGLFGLCLLAAGWMVLYLHARSSALAG